MALAYYIKVTLYRELIRSIDHGDGGELSIDEEILLNKAHEMAQKESAYYPWVDAADLDIWQYRVKAFCEEEGIRVKETPGEDTTFEDVGV